MRGAVIILIRCPHDVDGLTDTRKEASHERDAQLAGTSIRHGPAFSSRWTLELGPSPFRPSQSNARSLRGRIPGGPALPRGYRLPGRRRARSEVSRRGLV